MICKKGMEAAFPLFEDSHSQPLFSFLMGGFRMVRFVRAVKQLIQNLAGNLTGNRSKPRYNPKGIDRIGKVYGEPPASELISALWRKPD
jgi:hypothetical protein